ncbi:MAG: cysteine hydrolase [Parasporobacterium sp.]|nr:cysteine hydrolase [Parasporobacterium sp.]
MSENKTPVDVLIVVDMQVDFTTGALGSPEAEAIIPDVVRKVWEFDGPVFYTRDTHGENYLETEEGKHLPVIHCVKGTEGWQLIPELRERADDTAFIVDKPAFGSFELSEKLKSLEEEQGISSITLIGLCTDICVVSNALILKAAFPEVPVKVDSACCAGITPELHNKALDVMKSCQVEVY